MRRKGQYFDFLCNIVGRAEDYGLLLGALHRVEYYALIPNDDNRGEDGKKLREKYIDEMTERGLTRPLSLSRFREEIEQLGACTVLEMMIGLSFRLEFETAQSQWEKTPSEWFWVLIDNLGLFWMNDRSYMMRNNDELVQRIIQDMLDRKYDFCGNGGLFPLYSAKKDQRKVEIWYQMSAYILEKYPI